MSIMTWVMEFHSVALWNHMEHPYQTYLLLLASIHSLYKPGNVDTKALSSFSGIDYLPRCALGVGQHPGIA